MLSFFQLYGDPPDLYSFPTRRSSDLSWVSGTYTSFTSLPCASNAGGENPCIDTQDGWKASDCGRLGRQAAGQIGSAHVGTPVTVKDCMTSSVRTKPKQQLCIKSGTRA